MPTTTDERRTVIEVTPEARIRLKTVAARRGKTMKQLMDEIAARLESETFGTATNGTPLPADPKP